MNLIPQLYGVYARVMEPLHIMAYSQSLLGTETILSANRNTKILSLPRSITPVCPRAGPALVIFVLLALVLVSRSRHIRPSCACAMEKLDGSSTLSLTIMYSLLLNAGVGVNSIDIVAGFAVLWGS